MKCYQPRYKPLSIRKSERKGQNKVFISLLIAALLIYALFTWILPTVIGGISFFDRFKTQANKQTPVSQDPALAPPVLNIPYEATYSAQIKIKGHTLPSSRVEIYLDDDLKETTNADLGGSFTSAPINLNLGINNISSRTVDTSNNKSLFSKTIKILYSNEKPKLTVNTPSDNQITADNKVTVSGTVENNDSITVSINGIRIILKNDGSFSQTVNLNDGYNNIVVAATDTVGNTTQIQRRVTYQLPSPTPTLSPTLTQLSPTPG